MSHYDGPETEVKQIQAGSPTAKNANVKRLMKRLLMAATEETGDRRIVGFFTVTFQQSGNVGLAYALTVDEYSLAKEAVPAGLERALAVIRAATVKESKGSA